MSYKKVGMNQKRSRYESGFRGSITVEASFIFPVLFILIIMLVFLMMFYYNKLTVWKNTYYIGIKLVEKEREGTVYNLESEWKKISKETLVLPKNAQVSQKKLANCITVTGKVDFNIPFWGDIAIQEKSVLPLCSGRENMVRSKVWKK